MQKLLSTREHIVDIIKAELLGPGSEPGCAEPEKELISSDPVGRYSLGILYPQRETYLELPEEDADLEEELGSSKGELRRGNSKDADGGAVTTEDQENDAEELAMASQFLPSSMGITFFVRGNAQKVNLSAEFGTYRRAVVADCVIPFKAEKPEDLPPKEFESIFEYDRQKETLRLKDKPGTKTIEEIKKLRKTEKSSSLAIAMNRLITLTERGYVREPHRLQLTVDFSGGDFSEDPANSHLDGTWAKVVGRRLKVGDDRWAITLMLVNDFKRDEEESRLGAKYCLFQPRLSVNTEENGFVFVDTHLSRGYKGFDNEEKSLALLYRNKKSYATGHGAATDWNVDQNGRGTVMTEVMPEHEVPPIDFNLPENSLIANGQLSMKYYSDLVQEDRGDKLASLRGLVESYKKWVLTLRSRLGEIPEELQQVAGINIDACESAAERMFRGIKVLQEDNLAFRAFELANKAMFMQRVQLGLQAKLVKENPDPLPGDTEIGQEFKEIDYSREEDIHRWRPFQLAFILLDIVSITKPQSVDRNLIDLIWFPTGGGKTEAYLGLAAFTIFYRRLTLGDEGAGTAIIMRYTLRLLTSQQFTRASTLICACEKIRRGNEAELGKEPVSIGLWIGGSHIPNTIKEAKRNLDELETALSRSQNVEKYAKYQVLKCPWCATKMFGVNAKKEAFCGYEIRKGSFKLTCPNPKCDFSKELPIQVIDEELYKKPPTLLFATVDKFAMMTWNGESHAFFGHTAAGKQYPAPELIIQDELHLISGALGTIVGLYETSIDYQCSRGDVRPKIIASTATIRRAKHQCSALYNREVAQFPPPGLDADDSFFARERVIDHEKNVFGRRYVGVFPAGKTKVTSQVRLLAGLLQWVNYLKLEDEIKDKFWTLAVYYNSLKDLARATVLVQDDVKDFIRRICSRLMIRKIRQLYGENIKELTSRVSSSKLNKTLDKLERVAYTQRDAAAVDVVLATNMISVGIDIERLNTMVIVGQPKLTSEYIQASSRVGRTHPGVVFMLFDASKSRDRSHYESFRDYHESYYRLVEPTGVTPFSEPARDRALHSILVSMIRFKLGLFSDDSADEFDLENCQEVANEVKEFVLDRVKQTSERLGEDATEELNHIRREIDDFFEVWDEKYTRRAKSETGSMSGVKLIFGRAYIMERNPGESEIRLLKPFASPSSDPAYETLTSMRSVDTMVPGEIVMEKGQK